MAGAKRARAGTGKPAMTQLLHALTARLRHWLHYRPERAYMRRRA